MRVRTPAFFLLALTFCGANAVAKKTKAPEDGLPSLAEVTEQARVVYGELAGNSDPAVRRIVFEGWLELGKKDLGAALEMGLKDTDWTLRGPALRLALSGKDRKRSAAARKALTKLLESGEVVDREHGVELLKGLKPRAQLKALKSAAKLGAPEARAAARAALIKRGGKVAWAVVKSGLAEPPSEPEYKEAIAALETLEGPGVVKWAMANLHTEGELGTLARRRLRTMKGKAMRRPLKVLQKKYAKAAEFTDRLRIASVLAHQGKAELVKRTLLAGLKFRGKGIKIIAWRGLAAVRDLAILKKAAGRILTGRDEAQADAAFAWLQAWALSNGEAKVIGLLQKGARSDRRPTLLRSMKTLAAIKHRKSVPLFESAMVEGETEVRLAAAAGLAAVAKPGDEKRLANFLRREPNPAVKAKIVEALAKIGTGAIIDSLQYVVTAKQKSLKLAAGRAIAATGKPKGALLLGLLKRDVDLEVRFEAWHALLHLKPAATVKAFSSTLGWITGEQIEVLSKDPKVPVDVFALLAEKGNDEQRLYAVEALVGRGESSLTKLLSLQERSPHPETAAASLTALATLRKAASIPTYRKAIQSDHGQVRAAGYAAIRAYGPRALLEAAMTGMADDAEPAARAQATRAAVSLAGRE